MYVPYNPNVPANASSSIGDAQEQFLNNFLTLYNAFKANHVPLDATIAAGNHTIIQLLEQSTATQFQTNAGEISVYSKDAPGQDDQIFLRYQGNQNEFQYTCYQIYKPNVETKYFTFLPGRVIVYFGSIAVNIPVNSPNGHELNLLPKIAKNIITINFCPLGTTPNFTPKSAIPAKDANGVYSKVTILYPFEIAGTGLANVWYVVLANC